MQFPGGQQKGESSARARQADILKLKSVTHDYIFVIYAIWLDLTVILGSVRSSPQGPSPGRRSDHFDYFPACVRYRWSRAYVPFK